MSRPVVAIVGRPNVGKSSIFNRILGRRKALVQDTPGVTRDRNYALAEIGERTVLLCDTGGFEEREGIATERMARLIRQQALVAIEESDVIVFVMDIRAGLTATDEEIAQRLRGISQPVFYVLNKADHPKTDVMTADFYRLGVDGFFNVSAEHGLNFEELEDAIAAVLPEDEESRGVVEDPWDGVGAREKPSRRRGREKRGTAEKGGRLMRLGDAMPMEPTTARGPGSEPWDGDEDEAPDPEPDWADEGEGDPVVIEPGVVMDEDGVEVIWEGPLYDEDVPFDAEDVDPEDLADFEPEEREDFIPRIALLGRPNVGKSTLLNRLLGYQRSITSPMAGTTRDSVDVYFEHEGNKFVLIDTAGVRKRRRIDDRLEKLTVGRSLRTIEAAHVVMLLVDGEEGVTEQEARLAAVASEQGRAVIVVVNKWDLKPKGEGPRREFLFQLRRRFPHIAWADVMFLSALTGRGVHKIWAAIDRANLAHRYTISTGQLNRWGREIWGRTPPPMHKHRPVRFYYVTQTGIRPPTFTFFCNQPKALPVSYRRFLNNQLRAAFDLSGTPVRLVFKDRSGS
ncbi:MAG: ribosome biogenesis GTPase Der [Deltaproteobacteria bacterium]|nr:ribosome biogenesis GTPase Der [Deltaproteobacteria bacterium]